MVSKNAIGYFNLQRDWLLYHCDIIGDFKLDVNGSLNL